MMKWSIGAKIAGAFALALAVLVVVGGVSYYGTVMLIEASESTRQTRLVLGEIEALMSAMKDAETGQRGFTITGDEEHLKYYEDGREEASQHLAKLKELTAETPAQKERASKMEPLIQGKLAHLEEVVAARKQEGFEAAAKIIRDDRGKSFMQGLRELATEMRTEAEERLARRLAEEESRAFATKSIIVGGILACLVLLVALSYLLSKSIAKPLGELSEAARRIASGDIAVTLPSGSDRGDEVGALIGAFAQMTIWLGDVAKSAETIADGNLVVEATPQSDKDVLGIAFATMRRKLRHSTKETQDAASALASASSEIMASSTQVAASSSETATAVAETTTTVEEVKQTAQVSHQKARLVSENAQKASQIAQDGRRAVEEAIEGMRRIQEQMESIAETVVQLSEQSQAIGEIVATVADLAEQSNLLAVNAAIEAARAGEHGKSFAVVAQEVKSLAEQSKQATVEVRGILNGVQKAISGAVMATEQGAKTVESGARRAEEAGAAIGSLAETIEDGAQAALQIAASSQQQSVGMDQVAQAMENIKQASAQNAAGTKQTETAARNLRDIGHRLKELLAQYKV